MLPASGFDRFTVGDSASIERVVAAEDVARFVELTGDDNPVHLNEDFAAALGVGGRVVHGMLTASFVSTVVGTVLPGPGALWMSERLDFLAPVRVGDVLNVGVTVRHKSPATRALVLDVSIHNQHDKVVLDGEARVQVLEPMAGGAEGSARGAETVVVTGSGRGIGAAIAGRLAAAGCRVVLNYRSDEARAEETLRSIVDAGGEASLFRADVSDPGEAAALVAHAQEAFGSVDALVNNAGGPLAPRSLQDSSWEDMERHLATHLRGAFLCVQAALPAMAERGFGRIVNVTSQSAYGTPPPKLAGYVVAKAALAAYTRCLALEAGPHGVTANAVAPGMVETEMVSDVSPRTRMAQAASAPLRRLTRAEDVAGSVAFLIGSEGSHVTGQTIHLSGGQLMS